MRPLNVSFVAAPALGASLARCAGKSSVDYNVQLLERPITAVPRRSLCASVRCLSTAASSIRYSASLGVPRCRLSTLGPRPSLWPAHRFGTLYQTAWEIRILAGTASDVCWRRIYFHCTEAFSILEMFQDDTLYKLTYLLTYLLTSCYSQRANVLTIDRLFCCTIVLLLLFYAVI